MPPTWWRSGTRCGRSSTSRASKGAAFVGQLGDEVLGGLHALAPDRTGDDLAGVDAVAVAAGDLLALLQQAVRQRGGLQAEGQELVVADDQLVLVRLLPRVRQVRDVRAHDVGDQL